jgi:hypothetical protein
MMSGRGQNARKKSTAHIPGDDDFCPCRDCGLKGTSSAFAVAEYDE